MLDPARKGNHAQHRSSTRFRLRRIHRGGLLPSCRSGGGVPGHPMARHPTRPRRPHDLDQVGDPARAARSGAAFVHRPPHPHTACGPRPPHRPSPSTLTAPSLYITGNDPSNLHGSGGGPMSPREVLVGMIEEYARHMVTSTCGASGSTDAQASNDHGLRYMKMVLPQINLTGQEPPRHHECHIHRHAVRAGGDRAVPIASAARRTASTGHHLRTVGVNATANILPARLGGRRNPCGAGVRTSPECFWRTTSDKTGKINFRKVGPLPFLKRGGQ